MVVVSRVVRTPWVDLTAFAILAISYTGTKRTALVSFLHICWVLFFCLSEIVFMTSWTKTWGTKTGDTLNCSLFLSVTWLLLCLSKTFKVQQWLYNRLFLAPHPRVHIPLSCNQAFSFLPLSFVVVFIQRLRVYHLQAPPLNLPWTVVSSTEATAAFWPASPKFTSVVVS